MDLENFFPNITFPRVRKFFQQVGYSPCIATILALLCTECPRRLVNYDGQNYWVSIGPRGLPQGACTSPALSNQIARRLDKRLKGISNKLGFTYTRYADDLTFSGNAELARTAKRFAALVGIIVSEEGFSLNQSKSRVMTQSGCQRVTGVVVNAKLNVQRAEFDRLKATLLNCVRHGPTSQNRESHPDFYGHLSGRISHMAAINPIRARKLWILFDRIEWNRSPKE